MSDERKNRQDPDDFWDLSSLIPKNRAAHRVSPRAVPSDTRTVEISVPAHAPSPVQEQQTDVVAPVADKTVSEGERTAPFDAAPVLVPRTYTNESLTHTQDVPFSSRPVQRLGVEPPPPPRPEQTYRPEGSLMREVRIYPWPTRYDYYEQFRITAERLVGCEGTPCPEVDFFSYMPQYAQLGRAQLAYYLWWRTCFRKGECLPAAYSYLLLHAYELINLGKTHQNPQTGQENLLRLWLFYRDRYPALDGRMSEWLCDYSLLHALPAPALPADGYRTMLSGCRLKELFVPAAENCEALHTAILLFCNNYDYTKSKFYRADTKADYDRVLRGAIRVALDFLRERSGTVLTDAQGVSTLTRDAFAGAICSYRIKRRFEIDYTSFSHTHELRHVMTDVLKYAENALRAALGVKSRLSVYAVEIPLRERLDDYLKQAVPARRSRTASPKEAEIPAYERRYDLPVGEISPERAAMIEAESWQTTKRLVEAFSEEENAFTPQTGSENDIDPPIAPQKALPTAPAAPAEPGTADAAECPDSPFLRALGDLAAFLPLALARDGAAQREFARSKRLMVDAVADKINTVAGDMLGDIVLEEENGTFAVIPDYIELLTEEGAF